MVAFTSFLFFISESRSVEYKILYKYRQLIDLHVYDWAKVGVRVVVRVNVKFRAS